MSGAGSRRKGRADRGFSRASGRPIEERFWEKVDTSGECWTWKACISKSTGYGRFGIGKRTYGAHQASYMLNVGPIPAGMSVLHRCDNRPCVRPDHLYVGDQKQNIADAIERGRHVSLSGERAGNARLTDEQIREIRRRYEAGEPSVAIAADFDITRQYVWQLSKRQWRTTA